MRVFSFLLFTISLILFILFIAGCDVPFIAGADMAGEVKEGIAGVKADVKDIGNNIKASSDIISTEAKGARDDVKNAPSPIKEAVTNRAERIVNETANIGAQTKMMDQGIARQLDQQEKKIEKMGGLIDEWMRKAAALQSEVDRLLSLNFYLPFLFGLVVLGAMLLAPKVRWPDWPAEPGGIIIIPSLLGIVWIFLVSHYPAQTAIITGSIIAIGALILIAAIGLHVSRVNVIATTLRNQN